MVKNNKTKFFGELIGENTATSERYDKCKNIEKLIIKIPVSFLQNELLADAKYLIPVYATLFKKKDEADIISNISLNDIFEDNGIVPTKGKGRNIEQFKEALFQLIDEGLIEFHNEYVTSTLLKALNDPELAEEACAINSAITLKTPLSLFFNKKNYKLKTEDSITLNYRILWKMKKDCFKQKRVKIQNVLNIYLLIKLFVQTNTPHFCFMRLTHNDIAKRLKLSKATIIDTIRFLEENNYIIQIKENKNSIKYELLQENTPMSSRNMGQYIVPTRRIFNRAG